MVVFAKILASFKKNDGLKMNATLFKTTSFFGNGPHFYRSFSIHAPFSKFFKILSYLGYPSDLIVLW